MRRVPLDFLESFRNKERFRSKYVLYRAHNEGVRSAEEEEPGAGKDFKEKSKTREDFEMNQNKQDNHAVQGMTAAREAYEYAAGREALERVGNLPTDTTQIGRASCRERV